MKPPPRLNPSEAALWRKVADTVTPLNPPRARVGEGDQPQHAVGGRTAGSRPQATRPAEAPRHHASRGPPPQAKPGGDFNKRTLDGTWDRRLAHGLVAPDAQIDLHGLGIDAAYTRLMASLTQAHLTGARVLLVIAGKSRPHGDHDQRGNRRGAIRAKLIDWLAASAHASAIAAIRPAHQLHGGAGAVYVILRRLR